MPEENPTHKGGTGGGGGGWGKEKNVFIQLVGFHLSDGVTPGAGDKEATRGGSRARGRVDSS